MTKKEIEEMNQALDTLKNWYNNLSEKTKKKTALFAIVGDMKGHNNYEAIQGAGGEIVMTLAQSMLGREGLFSIVKDSVSVVSEYVKRSEEENKKAKEKKTKKVIVS